MDNVNHQTISHSLLKVDLVTIFKEIKEFDISYLKIISKLLQIALYYVT